MNYFRTQTSLHGIVFHLFVFLPARLQSTPQICHLACLFKISLQGWLPVLERPSDTGSTTHWWPSPGLVLCLSQHVSYTLVWLFLMSISQLFSNILVELFNCTNNKRTIHFKKQLAQLFKSCKKALLPVIF